MLKIGIIGVGYWGKHHLRVFSKLPCDLIGIADLDPAKEKLAKEYKIKFFTDFKKLLKKVDAVSIVTPPFTHFKIAKKALQQGKHVLVEKPFVLTKKEALELISMAQMKDKTLMIGHIYLYHPAVLELKQIVENGLLGKIYYVICQRLNLGIVRWDVNSLWNFAPHDLSALLYLFDMVPTEVSCFGHSYLQKDIEDISFLTLKFPQDILAHLIYSWLHPSKVRGLTIVGSKKMAVFDDVDPNAPLKIYDKGVEVQKLEKEKEWKNFGEFKMKIRFGDVITPSLEIREPLEAEIQHFLHCISTGETPRSDGVSGLKIVSILESATKSLKKGGKTIAIKY